ncbi:MAG: DUF1553 domain-containing protein [Isosphaeraceae bacterium]
MHFRDDYPITTAERRRAHEKAVAAWQSELTAVRAEILRLEKPIRDRVAPGLPMGALDEAVAAHRKPEAERTPAEVRMVFEHLRHDGRIRAHDWPRLASPELLARRQQLFNRLERIEKSAPAQVPTARGTEEAGHDPPPTFFLKRGEFTARGPAVEPAFPAVFGTRPPRIVRTARSSGRRSELARWLVGDDHPLTARVMVNRISQGHFGRGLVATSSDFGQMGDAPSHPELLDWLAREFMASGWSMKSLHRLIVTSATYRQRSTTPTPDQDAENLLLARQNRRRLDGEALRDALLVVSGRLNPALGGPGVFPPLPEELTRLSSKGQIWPISPLVGDHARRSLFIFVRRNLRYPLFEVFDRPDTNASCPRRPVTTIAPQALSLLNSPLAVGAASDLARRVADEAGTDRDGQVRRAYMIALARRPDETELALARDFLRSGGSFADLCLTLLNLNEFLYLD